MSAPSFVHPEWLLPLAASWLVLLLASAWALLRMRQCTVRLLGAGRPPGPGIGLARDALLLIALLAIVAGLLGPRLGTRSERIATSGVDVVLLLDVSRSMDARDVPPSRLDRARQAAAALLADLGAGDRAALSAFAGRGVLLTPLSPDHAALAEILPALDTSLVRPAASRLGEGVREALTAFEAGSDRPRVLVMLSDGEDPDGSPELGLAELRRAGVRVIAVALGGTAGATIPDGGLALRDRRGRIVTTRLDKARLSALVEGTDGALLETDAFGAVDPAALLSAVRRDAPAPGTTAGGEVLRSIPAVRVVPFALAALLILALEAGVGLRRAAPVVAMALAGAIALGASAGAKDPRSLLARGLALAAEERWEDAERSFRAAAFAAREPALAADAYHDAGVAAIQAGRLEAARDAFFEAAVLAPGDRQTRFNLEWTLRALAAPPTPPQAGTPQPASDSKEAEPRPAPKPEDGAPPAPRARPRSEPSPMAREPERPPALTPEEAERWLARAGDDPASALRGLGADEPAAPRGSPW